MDAVEEIKARLSIEDVVSEYVQLKRSGRNWKGLSPFSSERTPSFVVSPEKQIWHDFSSGKGGNMFSFVMELEGLDFKGALEHLARKANVDLAQYRRSSTYNGPDKERLTQALELATKFYQTQFSKNETSLRYVLDKRRFTKQTALEWRLGYAPNNGTALVNFLKSRAFTDDELKQAGLITERYHGMGDMFRGRLMVPLCDAQGRVIGFTARLLADDPEAPKYINTPQTVLYDKSRHVFGLHHAKESIRKNKFVVVVEGNLDVIASHQAGVKQTVAVAGTALTEHHLKILSRFTSDIRLCFDADKAGLAATERAIPLASRIGVSLSIITLPSGKDPDELVKQNPALWQEAVTQSDYALDWLMARYQALLDVTTATGKREFTNILLPLVKRLSDSVEQDHYMQAIAQITDVSRDALSVKLDSTATERRTLRTTHAVQQPPHKPTVEYLKAQDHLLAVLLMRPNLRTMLDLLTPDMFTRPEAQALLDFLQHHPEFSGSKEELQTLGQVQNLADYGKILLLQYEETYQGDIDFTDELTQLTQKVVQPYIRRQQTSIALQMSSLDPDDPSLIELSAQSTALNQLRHRVEGV